MRRQLQRTPAATAVDCAAVRLAIGCGSRSNAVSGVCSMSLNSLTEPRCLPRLALPCGCGAPALVPPRAQSCFTHLPDSERLCADGSPSGPATTAPKSRLPCWLRCRRFEGGFAGANSTWCAIPAVTSWALTAACASKHHDLALLFVASCPSANWAEWHIWPSNLLLFLMWIDRSQIMNRFLKRPFPAHSGRHGR